MGSRPARTAAPLSRSGALVALLAALAVAAVATPAAADGPLRAPAAPGQSAEPPPEPLSAWPQATLAIATKDREHAFRVWVADTPARRTQGLMHVRELAADRGMLFLFDGPQLASFWMKNTYVPLDLLFVAADGRIIRIAENATPHSLDLISSMGPVVGVVELRGGTARRLGIATGDRVRVAASTKRPAAGFR